MKIVLAPMHGFTDLIYRNALSNIYGGVDQYMAPFIRTVNGKKVNPKRMADVEPDQNKGISVIPQILSNNVDQFLILADQLFEMGHEEINLNMGCPYPMVTRKGAGAGMLQKLNRSADFLSAVTNQMQARLSVKVRIGFEDKIELPDIVAMLNSIDVSQVTVHPRTAVQMYKGKADPEAFEYCLAQMKHPLMYNGDVLSVDDYERLKNRFSTVDHWMLGRGILMDPALPLKMKGEPLAADEKKLFRRFHDRLFAGYQDVIESDHHVLDRMKSHWEYWQDRFANPRSYKKIKKANTLHIYQSIIDSLS